MRQIVVFQDATQQKVFPVDIEGVLIPEIRGKGKSANHSIISFDGKHTVHEINAKGLSALTNRHTAWHEFGTWYLQQQNQKASKN